MTDTHAIRLSEVAGTVLTRILVVEDDPVIGAATGLALEEAGGFTVAICDHGAAVLDTARRFRPDLLLLDADLPDMDGLSILSALRRDPDLAGLPTIFVTGYARPADTDRYRALSALGVIAKPFDPLDLADRVREIWEAGHG